MHDDDPLNDPELERIERRLGHAAWSPTPAQRERWLYACGQAAGRAEMRRRLRGATFVAAVLGCTSAALLAAIVVREKSPPVAAIDAKAVRMPQKVAVSMPAPEVATRETPKFAADQNRTLSVADGFDQLALAEVPTKVAALREQSSGQPVERLLTTTGPVPIEL
jgi:hypothetical protein